MNRATENWNSSILDDLLSEISPKEQEKVSIKMRVAARIADLLKVRDMRKQKLAESCDLQGASLVTKWLSGSQNFTLDTLVDISYALGVSVADLVKPHENRVVYSRSLNIVVEYPVGGIEKTKPAELVCRASTQSQTERVNEPLLHYAQQLPCLA